MPDWPWDFYAIVGGSVALAFFIIFLGKLEDRREAKRKAAKEAGS